MRPCIEHQRKSGIAKATFLNGMRLKNRNFRFS
uniref:Uncharacterized protein n=1 Tax=Anguilla anguilla TaxID=7936 RepID=A0A0E9VHX8_ANGAN